MFASMLQELSRVLECLESGMSVWIGTLRPLDTKFKVLREMGRGESAKGVRACAERAPKGLSA